MNKISPTDSFQPSVGKDVTVTATIENTRGFLAKLLIISYSITYVILIVAGAILLYASKIQFRDYFDLIIGGGAFSGLLTVAINFYFGKQ